MLDTIKLITDEFFFLSGRQRTGANALCVQHSPTAAALSTSFLLKHAPNSPELNAFTTRCRESCIEQREHESWVKKTEETKERLVEFWQCTETFEWKMWFSWFEVLLGRAEAHVIWGGKEKRVLTAYFISNISAKNIKMHSRMSKL